MPDFSTLPTDQLVDRLRRAAATWLRNDDLLLLEELIRQFNKLESSLDACRQIRQEDVEAFQREVHRLRSDPLAFCSLGEYWFKGQGHMKIGVQIVGNKIQVVERGGGVDFLAQQVPG